MAKSSKRSVRSRRVEHQERQKRQRLLIGILAVAGVIIVVGLVFWVRQLTSPEKNLVLPESLALPANADGKAWGPADAPVLVEDYSDFQ
jgi:hypothetical protein